MSSSDRPTARPPSQKRNGGTNSSLLGGMGSPMRRRKRRLCVANTHIYWDPEFEDVKLWQTWVLCQELEKLVWDRQLPMLLCGDFNSMPDSPVYDLLAADRRVRYAACV
jgi:mRNA deadenylase 3'-5' endonuclease subunit Ccr4